MWVGTAILLVSLAAWNVVALQRAPETCCSSARAMFMNMNEVCTDARQHDSHDVEAISPEPVLGEGEDAAPAESTWLDSGLCVKEYCLFLNRQFDSGRGMSVISTRQNLETIKILTDGLQTQQSRQESRYPPHLYVAEVSGKGLGLIANQSLRRGTPVMEKAPALVVHRKFLEQLPAEVQQPLLDAAVDSLPSRTRSLFLSQMGHFGGPKITDILATNSFQMDLGGSDGHHYGNYPEVSRFNHDCRPNVAFYISKQMLHTTTAVRPVEPGEELTITYLDSLEPRAARQKRALHAWGFKCACAQCSLPAKQALKSDARLREIARIQEQLQDPRSAAVTQALIRRFVKLTRDERLDFAIAGAYTLAATNYNMLGDEKMAVKYAELAVEAGSLEYGPASGDVREMRALLRDPKGHYSWRRRHST